MTLHYVSRSILNDSILHTLLLDDGCVSTTQACFRRIFRCDISNTTLEYACISKARKINSAIYGNLQHV